MRRSIAASVTALGIVLSLSVIDAQPLTCAGGFGQDTKVIPPELINDGYCDCPLDGKDEPETEACSGSTVGGWAGIPGNADSSPYMTCPQQPSVLLPLSRIHDGICDCCDGTDEAPGTCLDICEQVLSEERAARRKLEQDFAIGYEKRQRELQEFQVLLKETTLAIEHKEQQLQGIDQQLDDVQRSMDQLKLEYAQGRFQTMTQALAHVQEIGLLEPLTNDELAALIQFSCQLAGEMEGASDDASTCVPLRLAGIDLGLVWDEKHANVHTADMTLIANLMDWNEGGDNIVWTEQQLQTKPPRSRRLDELDADDDYYPDMDEDVFNANDGDEAIPKTTEKPIRDKVQKAGEGITEEDLDGVKATMFSQPRVAFLSRSSQLISRIDEMMKVPDGDEEEDDEEGAEPSIIGSVDPMSFQMTRNTLRRREQMIQRGFGYAVFAKKMVAAVQESENARDNLIGLAVGTLFHGKIKSADVWPMLHAILPEFDNASSTSEGSCASPWALLCPPQVVQRAGRDVPPSLILQAAQAHCEYLASILPPNVCSAESDEEIPSNTPDGYLGYYLVQPRDASDGINTVFARFEQVEVNRPRMDELSEKRRNLEDEKTSLQNNIKELDDKVGGRMESRFGSLGELRAMSDECLSVEAGRYVYEVCIFGQATQRERGSKSGQDLGRWIGMEVDNDSQQRILKWEHGAKCWNGPQRSATVYIKCGAESRLISAEEPDTCRYVLEMESYIACDEAMKARLGL